MANQRIIVIEGNTNCKFLISLSARFHDFDLQDYDNVVIAARAISSRNVPVAYFVDAEDSDNAIRFYNALKKAGISHNFYFICSDQERKDLIRERTGIEGFFMKELEDKIDDLFDEIK